MIANLDKGYLEIEIPVAMKNNAGATEAKNFAVAMCRAACKTSASDEALEKMFSSVKASFVQLLKDLA